MRGYSVTPSGETVELTISRDLPNRALTRWRPYPGRTGSGHWGWPYGVPERHWTREFAGGERPRVLLQWPVE